MTNEIPNEIIKTLTKMFNYLTDQKSDLSTDMKIKTAHSALKEFYEGDPTKKEHLKTLEVMFNLYETGILPIESLISPIESTLNEESPAQETEFVEPEETEFVEPAQSNEKETPEIQKAKQEELVKQFINLSNQYEEDINNNKKANVVELKKILSKFLALAQEKGSLTSEEKEMYLEMQKIINKYIKENIKINKNNYNNPESTNQKDPSQKDPSTPSEEQLKINTNNKLNLLINILASNKRLIAQNVPERIKLLDDAENFLKDLRIKFTKNDISVNECEEQINKTVDEINTVFGYYLELNKDTPTPSKPKFSTPTPSKAGNSNPPTTPTSKATIAAPQQPTSNNTKEYEDLIILATNYIRLMENNQMYATRSKEAINKQKSTKESIERYTNLLKQIESILKSAKTKDTSSKILKDRLDTIIDALKREYGLDIKMMKTPERKTILHIRNGIYGAGGIALGVFGVRRIISTIKVITSLSINFVSIPAAIWTVTVLLLSGNLLFSAVKPEGRTIIEKIISNLIGENKVVKKGKRK